MSQMIEPSLRPVASPAAIRTAFRFPPLPQTLSDVAALLGSASAEPDTPRLAEIVAADPIVGAAVLRRVNSAFYGMRRHVADIRKAVFLLGYTEVCNLVMAASLLQLEETMPDRSPGSVFDRLMRRSIGTAYFAEKIAAFLHLPHQALTFSAGLLHTLGRLILLYNHPESYERLWATLPVGTALTPEIERTRLQADHLALNGAIAEQWYLPPFLADVIQGYAHPEQLEEPPVRTTALAVHVAVIATEQLCLIGRPEHPPFVPPAPFELLLAASPTALPTADVQEFVERQQPHVCGYVEAMMQR